MYPGAIDMTNTGFIIAASIRPGVSHKCGPSTLYQRKVINS